MSLHLHPHSRLLMRAANALVSLRISAGLLDPLMRSIAIRIKWHYFMSLSYHVYIEIEYYS